MLGFTDLCKNTDEISKNNFVNYEKNDLKKINSAFDLIFLPSSQFTEDTDQETNETVFSNLKYLLKPDGILFCSFTNIFQEDSLWYENIFNYFAKQKNLISKLTPFSEIAKDRDLFYLSEKIYIKYWEEFTGKTYYEFGTAFCNNLIFENHINISENNFDNFVFPKKSHRTIFTDSQISTELYNIKSPGKIMPEHLRLLTIYSFIKNNFGKGSSLLCIGKFPEPLLNKLKGEYSLYQSGMENFRNQNSDYGKSIKYINSDQSSDKNEGIKYNEYFDFIFSFNEDFQGNILNPDHQSLKRHITYLLKPDGTSCISFKIYIQNKSVHFPPLLEYLLKSNVMRAGRHVKKDDIIADDELCFLEIPANTRSALGISKAKLKETFYNLLFKKEQYLPALSLTKHSNNLSLNPVYVFHHLMKCGGTSLFNALDLWFKTIDDNILDEDLNNYVMKKYNTEVFHSDVCLRAHFQKDGIHLHQRYPELLKDKEKYRVFTFIRDPLSVKISKYYFLKSLGGRNFKTSLKDSILKDKNFLSGLFPCNESNYKEMLDRYFFIGIVENFQGSFDKFADLIGKRRIKLPVLNISNKDFQIKEIDPDFIEKFRELNELDYRIYEYCVTKFDKIISRKSNN